MKWIYKLENKFGKYYIPNLMKTILIGMAIVYIVNLATSQNNPLIAYLSLYREPILQGQIWRLVTFIFVPVSQSPIWFVISLYLYYSIGQMLESSWGGFKFNLYFLIGMLGAIIVAFITGGSNNNLLFFSLFLAFATAAPDNVFYLFMIIPLKAKWLAIAYAVLEIYTIFSTSNGILSALIALLFALVGLINYILFFGGSLIEGIQQKIRIEKNKRNWKNRNK